MKIIIDKYSKFLFKIILIFLFIAVIYFLCPKYQISTVRVDNNTVLITKINTITGKVTTERETIKVKEFSKPEGFGE